MCVSACVHTALNVYSICVELSYLCVCACVCVCLHVASTHTLGDLTVFKWNQMHQILMLNHPALNSFTSVRRHTFPRMLLEKVKRIMGFEK